MITFREYEEAARRTMNRGNCTPREVLAALALGVTGEAGEVADHIKKHLIQGHQLDRVKVLKELGDVAWYIAMLASEIGYDFESVVKLNVEKLKERYPYGFKVEASVERKDD